ncbi:MAG: ABC transporter permease [Leptospiraceae bacterium]|nr:ABC transporter permease [Leptospiraceae bacterium]NUM41002.1 ABC transporter permease [Leptospiraceae bacterium]
MFSEFYKFIFFLLLLSSISVILSKSRMESKEFLFADSGLQETKLTPSENLITKIFQFQKSIFLLDFGKTDTGEKVIDHISNRLIPTIHLSIFSILLGSLSGIGLSLFLIIRDNKLLFEIFTQTAKIILSTPIFVVSVLLLLIFFYYLEILPPGGYEKGNILYLVMPGIALGSRVFARQLLLTYDEAKTEMNSYYIIFLKARGFTINRIVFKHVLIKIFPVILIFILMDFGSILSGAIIVEEIFFFPGIGKSMYIAIKSLDENLLQALFVYTGIVFYLFGRIARNLQSILSGKGLE